MNYLSVIKKNIISLASAEILTKAFGLILFIFLARYLGPEKYGVYSLAITFFIIFGMVSNYGLDTLLLKDISRDLNESHNYVFNAIIIKLTFSIASIIIIGIVIYVIDYPQETQHAILIYSFSIIFFTITEVLLSAFRAYQTMEYVAITKIARSLIALIFILTLIYFQKSILLIITSQVVSFFLVFGISYWIAKKVIKISISYSIEKIKYMIKYSFPFFIIGISSILNYRMDIMMLSALSNNLDIGFYSAGFDLISTILVFPLIISTVLFPIFSGLFGESKVKFEKMGNFSIKILIIIGVPLAVGIYFYADKIVNLVFNEEYQDSVQVLQVLGIGIGLTFCNSILGWILTAMNKENYIMKGNVISIILNIILNYIFIPIFFFFCTAITTGVSRIFLLIYMDILLKKKLSNIQLYRMYLLPIIPVLIMGLILFNLSNLNMFIGIIIAIIVYLVTLLLTRVFTSEELNILKLLIKVK